MKKYTLGFFENAFSLKFLTFNSFKKLMSYVEKSLYWFMRNHIFGGFKKLKNTKYLPTAILMFGMITINTILVLLYKVDYFMDISFIKQFLLLELFIGFGIGLGGMLTGHIKNPLTYQIIWTISVSAFIIIYFFGNINYQSTFLGYIKLLILFSWVTIWAVSFFFFMIYFFTSFTKKIITLGMPKDHIFFGWITKLVLIISIPFYIYLITKLDTGNVVLGFLGLIGSCMILYINWIAPKKTASKEKTVEKETKGIINFATSLGFISVFLLFLLINSFPSSSQSATSLITDLIMLILNMLYLIQSITYRISKKGKSPDQFSEFNRVQSRLSVTYRIKKIFGESGLVLITLSIALGYHFVFLDSFFTTEIPILSEFITEDLNMSAIYYRIYLLISYILIIFIVVFFFSSKKTRELTTDKYTNEEALIYLGRYLQGGGDGKSMIEMGIDKSAKKIGEIGRNLVLGKDIDSIEDNDISKARMGLSNIIGASLEKGISIFGKKISQSVGKEMEKKGEENKSDEK